MKKVIFIATTTFVFLGNIAFAESVRGYTRQDGTYVGSYNRSKANDSTYDNYSYSNQGSTYGSGLGSMEGRVIANENQNYNNNSNSRSRYFEREPVGRR